MLILKQNAANTVPTPPAGKGTIFLDDSDVLSVKTSDGNVETFPTVGASNAQVVFMNGTSLSGEAAFTYDFNNNVLTVSGNVAAGNVKTDNLLYANGTAWDLQQPGGSNTQVQFNDADSFGGSANYVFNKTTNNLTVTGNIIDSSGAFYGNGAGLTNIPGGNVSGAVAYATTANAVAGANVSGTVSSATTAGTVTTAAQPNITSVGTLSSLTVSGNISAGNVSATTFTGALSGAATTAGTVTTAAQPNITSVGTLTSLAVTGNVTAGNVSATTFTGALSGAATTAGTVTTAAQPNITSVGTLTSVSVTGNVAAGNLTTTGVLSVTGTGVSSIAGNLDMTSNNIINLATPVNSNDAATKQYVDDVAQGLHTHDSCNAATDGTLATISGGTVTYNNGTSGVGATLTTTGSYTTIDGVTLSNGMRILVKNEANTAHNGIYDRTSSTVLTRSSDFDTPAEMAGGDFTFVTAGTLYDNTGWVMTDPVTTVGTSPVPWVQFSGAGTYTAGTGLTLTGSQFSITNTAVSAASYGNGDRVASFTVNAQGQLTAASNVVIAANAANLTGTTLASSIVTSSLTTVGTLGSLSVTGNANVGNIGAAAGVFTTVSGNGSALTDLNASNISSGTLAQARLANSSLTINGSAVSLGGSVTVTATATNALTLGTYLTGTSYNGSSAVTAAVDATSTNTASKVVARDGSGNFAAGTITATLSGAATTAGTVTTAAQPNITSVGTLSSLSVSGQLTNANLTTGGNTTAGSLTGNWTLTAGSRLQATYADLAEKYVADASYPAGTVLLFGGDHEVTISNATDSHSVAGVVSTNPAYIMNSGCQGEHVVDLALQGRVPVKVQGHVRKGDLMVSGLNGYAVANNTARAGTIIGKALENFSGDHGVIEIVVGRV